MTNAFDKLLGDSLRAGAAANGGVECLDGEVLAAWFDGTLPPPERAAVETHAAGCARCQAMVAALVRTDRPSRRAWWHAPAVRWLVPLAVAAAAVVVVRVLLPARGGQATPALPSAAVRQAESQQAAVGNSAAAPQRDAVAMESPGPARMERRKADEIAADRARAAAAPASGISAGALPAQSAAASPRLEPLNDQIGGATPVPAPPQVPLATPAPPASEASAGGLAATSRVAQAQPAPRTSPPPAPPRVADAGDQVGGLAETVAIMPLAGRAGGGVVIATADQMVRWRVAGQRRVERSADGGLTWQAQPVGAPAALAAGSAPSGTVCWLVGGSGLVLRTSDAGRTWTRVPFAEAVDLVAIAASSADSATITTAGGRRYETTDGGASWK